MPFLLKAVLIYLCLINLFAFFLTLYDKRRAILGKWRVPERALLTVSALGGALGMLIAMHAFHHKTRKKKFSIGVPLLLIFDCLLLAGLYYFVYL